MRKMPGLFVTATDTGVGKTEVACALLRGWRAAGLDVAALKPAQSGVSEDEPSDAARLAEAAAAGEPMEQVCPYSFAAPLAPAVAARLAGVAIDFGRVVDGARALAARHAALVVEGAGGLLVPLTERETYADLAVALGLPVLIVARAGLGTVNHTALTVEALRARGLSIAGIVMNRTAPEDDPSVRHNATEIARLTGIAPAALLPYVADIGARAAALRSTLAGKIQF
jgi:dethiobiotin synthetase